MEATKILRQLVPLVENLEDSGPAGAGWQSAELIMAIAEAKEFLEREEKGRNDASS